MLAFFFVLFTFSSIGLPGLNGFAGEFLILIGMFQRAWIDAPQSLVLAYRTMAVLAVFGVVLGAWYMLWLVQRVFFGPLKEADHSHGEPPVRDLSPREIAALAPLVVFIFGSACSRSSSWTACSPRSSRWPAGRQAYYERIATTKITRPWRPSRRTGRTALEELTRVE